MERIGITASKIAKGRLVLYNFYVVFLSFLFSLFIFFIAGASIMLALIVIGYILEGVLPGEFGDKWQGIIRFCMVGLTVVIGVFNLFAIMKNIKISRD